MSIAVERLQAHVEVTGVKDAERELTSFKAKADTIIKGLDRKITLDVDANMRGVKQKVEAEIKSISASLPPIKIKVELDYDRSALGSIQQAARMGGRRATGAIPGPTIPPGNVPTPSPGNHVPTPSQDPVHGLNTRLANAALAGGLLLGVLKGIGATAVAAGIKDLVAGVEALGGGIVSLLGPTASLVGLLGGLPPVLAAVGMSFAVLKLGTSGVMESIKLGSKIDDEAKDNKLKLRDATWGLVSAEHGLLRAQEGVVDAQKNLIRARKDALRSLIDMRFASQSAALGEQAAVLALTSARKELARINGLISKDNAEYNKVTDEFTGRTYDIARVTADATDLQDQRAQAVLAVKQAELALAQAQEQRKRATEDLGEAERKGVSGADNVIQAQRALRDSNWGLVDAQHSLTKALEAYEEARKTATVGNEAFRKSLEKLSPAGREFVQFWLKEIKPLWETIKKDAGDGVLPGLQSGIQSGLPFLKLFRDELVSTGSAIGDVIAQGGDLVGSNSFLTTMRTIFTRNRSLIRTTGGDLLLLVKSLGNVATEASPVVEWIETISDRWSKAVLGWSERGRNSGSLERFFHKATVEADHLLSVAGSLFTTVKNIARAGTPLGDSIIKGWERGASALERMTGTESGQKRLADWFEKQRRPLSVMWKLAKDILVTFHGLSNEKGFITDLEAIRTSLLPSIANAINKISANGFLATLIESLSKVIDLFGTFASVSGPVMAVVTAIGLLADTLNKLLTYIPGLNQLVSLWITWKAATKGMSYLTSKAGETAVGKAIGAGGPPGKTDMLGLPSSGSSAGAQIMGGAAIGAIFAVRLKQGWDQARRAAEEYKTTVTDALSQNRFDDAKKALDENNDRWIKAKENADAFANSGWAGKAAGGVKAVVGELLGMNTIIDDAHFAAKGEEARAAYNQAMTTVNSLSATLDLNKDKVIDLLNKYGIDPTKESFPNIVHHLEVERDRVREIADAWDTASRKYDTYQSKFGPKSELGSKIAISDARKQIGELKTGNLGAFGKFNYAADGAGELVNLVNDLMTNQFNVITEQAKQGKLTVPQAEKAVFENRQKIIDLIAPKFGNDKAALNDFLKSMGLDGPSIVEQIKLIESEVKPIVDSFISQSKTSAALNRDAAKALEAYKEAVKAFGEDSPEAQKALGEYVRLTKMAADKNVALMDTEPKKAAAMDASREAVLRTLRALGLTNKEAQDFLDKTAKWKPKLETKVYLDIYSNLSTKDKEIIDFLLNTKNTGKVVPHGSTGGGGGGGSSGSWGGRWGAVTAYAFGGITPAHITRKQLFKYGEPETGGEAFIPRIGLRNRSESILRQAAGWYKGAYLSREELDVYASSVVAGMAAAPPSKPDKSVTMVNHFHNEQDPMHTATEIAWQLR